MDTHDTPETTQETTTGITAPPRPAVPPVPPPGSPPPPAPWRSRTRVGLALTLGLLLGAGAMAAGLLIALPALHPTSPPQPQGAPAETTRTAESPQPAASAPALDANVVTVDDAEAQRLKITPVQLRSFREEKTAVGRIAFNDDRTTSIFAPFSGRVQRLIAKAGDVLHVGSPLLVL